MFSCKTIKLKAKLCIQVCVRERKREKRNSITLKKIKAAEEEVCVGGEGQTYDYRTL